MKLVSIGVDPPAIIGFKRPIYSHKKVRTPVVIDETEIHPNHKRFWLYANVDPATNCPLHIKLSSTRDSAISLMFLSELHGKHRIDNALFLADNVLWPHAVYHRHGSDPNASHVGIESSVERVFLEKKRRTNSFSNCFSHAEADTAKNWLQALVFARNQFVWTLYLMPSTTVICLGPKLDHEMNTFRIFRFGILFLILVNSAYLRGISLGSSVTSSYLVMVWVALATALVLFWFLRTEKTVIMKRWWVWFALIAWTFVSFGVNFTTRPYPLVGLQFIAELSLNFLLFITVLYLLDEDMIEQLYRKFLGVSSVVGLGLLVYPAFSGASRVRRVGGYELPGAVNNISTMLAVGVVIAVVGIVQAGNWRDATIELVALPTIIAGVLLSASRAAMIGLGISIGVLSIISDIDTKRIVAVVGSLTAGIFFFIGLLYERTGLHRFAIAGLRDAVNTRLSLYRTAIVESGLEPMNLLFGGGMYRYAKIAGAGVDTIIYPHNYVVSLMVHVGLFAAVIFAIALIWNFRSLLYFSVADDGSLDYVATVTLLSLIVISMYVFTSGRITRTFPLWIFLAISEFIYASRVLNLNPRTKLVSLRSLSNLRKLNDRSSSDRSVEDVR